MTLSLTIGQGAITLVQSGPRVLNTSGTASATLAAPSTPGTTLIAALAEVANVSGQVTAAPPGWVRLGKEGGGAATETECWAYFNNPGGIVAANFVTNADGILQYGHLSEWANCVALEVMGTAHATSGSAITPVTAGGPTFPGDLVIAFWIQELGGAGSVTFTSPVGFTRLIDDGAQAGQVAHLDAEYQIGPAIGLPLGPTLSSTGTTGSASSIVVVLRGGSVVDQTAYLKHD